MQKLTQRPFLIDTRIKRIDPGTGAVIEVLTVDEFLKQAKRRDDGVPLRRGHPQEPIPDELQDGIIELAKARKTVTEIKQALKCRGGVVRRVMKANGLWLTRAGQRT